MQPAVSGLSEEFPGKVVGQNVEAGLPDSIADIEALGFNNHGLVIRSDDGTVVWKQTFQGNAATRLFRAGDAVVFLSSDPGRIHVVESDTGRRLVEDATYTAGRRIYVRHVSENLLLLHHEGRFVEAYGLPHGRLLWRVELARYLTRGIAVGTEEMVFVATRRVGKVCFNDDGRSFASIMDSKYTISPSSYRRFNCSRYGKN